MKNLSVLEFGLLSKCIFLNQTSEESSFPFVSLSIDDPTKLETIRVKQLLSFLCRELPKTRIRVQYVKSDVVQKTRELGSSVAEKCHNVGTSDAPGKSAEQEKIPTDENRFDGKEHWSEYGETVRKCRLCSSPVNWTYVSCKKCQVPLCFNKYRNCFNTFHRQQP